MRKIYGITTFIALLLVSFIGITYSYEYNENELLTFELIGPYELNLNLNDKYEEYGIKVIKNGVDISSLINIDSSLVNTSRVGKYKVKYELIFDDYREYVYRVVNVKESVSPEIKLLGDEIIYLNVGESYIEPGYEVMDNYDINLREKVIIKSDLIEYQVGEYTIEYKVVDSSGNEGIATRKIIIK